MAELLRRATRVNGSERIGWDQRAPSLPVLQSYTFIANVDGLRTDLPDARCETEPGSDGQFACSAPLPRLSTGLHAFRVLTVVRREGRPVTSPASPMLLLLKQEASSR